MRIKRHFHFEICHYLFLAEMLITRQRKFNFMLIFQNQENRDASF